MAMELQYIQACLIRELLQYSLDSHSLISYNIRFDAVLSHQVKKTKFAIISIHKPLKKET